MADPVPRLLVGVDWATEAHQVCVLDSGGNKVEDRLVPATGEGLHQLSERLWALAPAGPASVWVAIEVNHGPVVETLVERGFTVFAINPKQLDRFRDRHTMAGAKDDRLDAYVLADSLRTHSHLFQLLKPDDPTVVQLQKCSRMLEDLGHEHVRLSNRVREQLRRYYPQMLQVENDVGKDWVLDLWELVPTPSHVKRVHVASVAKVLARHHIRRLTAAEIRVMLLERPVFAAPGTVDAAVAHIRLAADRLRMVNTQIRTCQRKLDELTEHLGTCPPKDAEGQKCEQRDVQILRSLPGVGRIVLATLLAEAARPLRERDYQTLRGLSGIAPITRASGKRYTAVMRRACNLRLRNACYHWARTATQCDDWSRAFYRRLRARGKTHGRALRGLGDRLLAIACSGLRHQTEYDPRQLKSAA